MITNVKRKQADGADIIVTELRVNIENFNLDIWYELSKYFFFLLQTDLYEILCPLLKLVSSNEIKLKNMFSINI